MSFDVPKLVRNPGCDHGHDEESRNGRDIKIDILDHDIRTPEVFREVSGKTGVPEGLSERPGGTNVPLWALVEREEGSQGRPPLPLGVRIGQGKGGGAPLSYSLSLSFLPPLFLVGVSY